MIVIGAGAAGLMCAAIAGQRGRRVLLLDHAAEPGRKILISGGGRCNFTNTGTAPERFFSANPHFARSALARYTAADFCALVARHGIASHEKTLGPAVLRRLGPRHRADAAGGVRAPPGVDMRLGHRVTGLARADRFTVDTDHGPFTAARWCWRPAGSRSPSWAPPASPTTPPGASACRSPRCGPRWCRCWPTTTTSR